MKSGWSFLVSSLVVVALSVLAVSQAHASCTGGDQISPGNAQCLTATKTALNSLTDSYTLTTNCSDYGTVSAKLNYRNAAGGPEVQTFSLTSDNTQQTGTVSKVEGMYCCKDLGDLCNRSDVVTTTSCDTRFDGSPAATSCSPGTTSVNSDHTQCTFNLTCSDTAVEATVAWTSVPNMRYCSGTIQFTDC